MGRFARNVVARASGSSVALSQLWPGRADRLIIAPHDLRTADATRAAEIYAGRFVFAGKIVTCHGRSVFDLEPPSEDWEVALLGFGWLRHLRAADTARFSKAASRGGRWGPEAVSAGMFARSGKRRDRHPASVAEGFR